MQKPVFLESKIESLISTLASQGKVTVLSDEETQAISERFTELMTGYRQELAIKEAQSINDTRNIILNA